MGGTRLFQSKQNHLTRNAETHGDAGYAGPGAGVTLHPAKLPMALAELAGGAGMGEYRSDFRELHLAGMGVAAQV